VNRAFAVVRFASIMIAACAVFVLLRTPGQPPTEEVRQAFAEYRRAVMANDGTAAAALLSAGTIEWYGRMQDLALHGSREEVEHLGPLEKLQVFAFRLRIPADELRPLSPRQLVAYSVTHGWIGKSGTEHSELGAITISDGSAVAELMLSGKDSEQQYRFVQEGDQWRFNQLPTLEVGGGWITTAAAQRGMTIDQFVQLLVETGAGKKMSTETWEAPFPRATPATP
jgi:hypothetical protein